MIWDVIKGFFASIYERFNLFLQDSLQIDNRLIGLYEEFVAPLPELIKIVGIVFVSFIIVFGTIGFVKKLLKLFIVLALILAVVLMIQQLGK